MARNQNPKKAIMSEILEDVLGQVVQKRWLCPICDRFDSVCGTSDKNEVWRHILRHGKYLMDERADLSRTKKCYKCRKCSKSFKGQFFSEPGIWPAIFLKIVFDFTDNCSQDTLHKFCVFKNCNNVFNLIWLSQTSKTILQFHFKNSI